MDALSHAQRISLLAPQRRASAAAFQRAGGVPLNVTSEALGHSSIAIRSKVYAHAQPALKCQAAERTAALLQRAQKQA